VCTIFFNVQQSGVAIFICSKTKRRLFLKSVYTFVMWCLGKGASLFALSFESAVLCCVSTNNPGQTSGIKLHTHCSSNNISVGGAERSVLTVLARPTRIISFLSHFSGSVVLHNRRLSATVSVV
jgi:hypothetical protein